MTPTTEAFPTPRAPVRSQPREPGRALPPGCETLQVPGGGARLLMLASGDRLTLADACGRQPAALLALAADGTPAPAALGLDAEALAEVAPDLNPLVALSRDPAVRAACRAGLLPAPALARAVQLWHGDTAPGHSISLVATAPLQVLVAAPGEAGSIDTQDGPTPLAVTLQRAALPARSAPPLPPPLGELVEEFTIAPGTARSYRVAAGQYIQVLDVAGRQCSDFVAFNAKALARGEELDLDPTVTRTLNGNAYPAPGLFARYYDRMLQPMLEVVQDTVGRHDTFALACTARYYEGMGYFDHANCSDNLSATLAPHGVRPRPGWPAINFFFNTAIGHDQQLGSDEPWSRPGDYVLMRALEDLVCASSACPDDIDPANGWEPTEIHIRIYAATEHFSMASAHRPTPDAEPELTRESGFHAATAQLTRHFVDYRGWWTAMRYDGWGPIAEYHACRDRVAAMDLSALRKFEVLGPDAEALLQLCLTRDVKKLAVGQVVYSAMCFPHGGMLDDGTLLRLGPDNFRWVCGDDRAGPWLREQAETLGLKVWVKPATAHINNLSVQGPRSRELLSRLIWTPGSQPKLDALGWFRFLVGRLDDYNGPPLMVSRTGYTGELGYEIWCAPKDAPQVWARLRQEGEPLGLAPLGLEALDMLRIEAGLVFAGHEFCDQTDPYEAGIGFAVPLKSKQDDFIGRDALLARNASPQRKLVGLAISGNEAAAHGDPLFIGRAEVGVVTSACRSPRYGNIALARIDIRHAGIGEAVEIGKLDGLQKRIGATVAAPIFHDPEKKRVRA